MTMARVNANAKWWHSHDHHSPNMSKASLGEFFHAVLQHDVEIGQVWVFDRRYHRSAVYVTVKMTDETRIAIESATRFRFVPPPKIALA
jgi:hypothetical protein